MSHGFNLHCDIVCIKGSLFIKKKIKQRKPVRGKSIQQELVGRRCIVLTCCDCSGPWTVTTAFLTQPPAHMVMQNTFFTPLACSVSLCRLCLVKEYLAKGVRVGSDGQVVQPGVGL